MSQHVAPQEILERIREFLGNDLLAVQQAYQQELETSNPFVRDLLQHSSRFQGKRLRSILLLLSARTIGDILPAHHTLAAVIEMIHAATLVHDDVLDESEIRRHVATINTRWNNETSVLFGDYLFTHAFHLTSTLGSAEYCRLIGQATNRVCEGELTQIHHRGNLDLSEQEYFNIIEGKTAELCAVACELGAMVSGATDEQTNQLREFGRCLGIAFQIVDDVLDVIGDEDQTGKTLGTDFEKQKLTLPAIRFLAQSPEAQQLEVRNLLTQSNVESHLRLSQLIRESSALDESFQEARSYIDRSLSCLSNFSDSTAKTLLLELSSFSIERNF